MGASVAASADVSSVLEPAGQLGPDHLKRRAASSSRFSRSGTFNCILWDGENRPVRIVNDGNGKTSEFHYGADGARIRKAANTGAGGSTEWSSYLGPEIEISLQPESGHYAMVKYVTPEAKRVGWGVSSQTYFHHRDHLKSIRMVTDGAGDQKKRSTYLSYGDQGLVSNPANHREEKGYIGERGDAETGQSRTPEPFHHGGQARLHPHADIRPNHTSRCSGGISGLREGAE